MALLYLLFRWSTLRSSLQSAAVAAVVARPRGTTAWGLSSARRGPPTRRSPPNPNPNSYNHKPYTAPLQARLADALLVLTGSVASEEVLEARLLELLLHEMSRYPGVVVLCCSSYDAYDAVYAM